MHGEHKYSLPDKRSSPSRHALPPSFVHPSSSPIYSTYLPSPANPNNPLPHNADPRLERMDPCRQTTLTIKRGPRSMSIRDMVHRQKPAKKAGRPPHGTKSPLPSPIIPSVVSGPSPITHRPSSSHRSLSHTSLPSLNPPNFFCSQVSDVETILILSPDMSTSIVRNFCDTSILRRPSTLVPRSSPTAYDAEASLSCAVPGRNASLEVTQRRTMTDFPAR
ncbi:hypothetical protein BU24DRAFT_475768 [Aaosphaeria arxii CBS 175.79]|uniref:Uncharacterized protein n=1 Tax=Aaosphaeria arxii CBS 175.79 TaxID=1450172 RepID=A0A6A5Y0D7_9PLEO|nr:uncharacterized protein BU24DRAFT_475768 [Aaosphaeria arxii CBS 175.79]KAF2018719.1 hypothetical protein BU24DRAFT_475768 [Aaosphaeria arxii CBS 175.79]